MGIQLTHDDEGIHPIGPASNWNESRYVDFWDARQQLGGWFRIGNRPNEGHGEVSACVYLPDGIVAFWFERARISTNTLQTGGQHWEILRPWSQTRVRHRGEMLRLEDPWMLKDAKSAFATAPREHADIDLQVRTQGLPETMGFDQDHIERIFVPGQADCHYQHLVHVTGAVRIGDRSFTVDGRGGKDHSWGPRNWHAKIYLRWIICAFDDANGFMLVRAVGPTKQTRGGFVLEDGRFHLVDSFEMRNDYSAAPHYELERMTLRMHAGGRQWSAVGIAKAYVPLRHVKQAPDGQTVLLRMVKSPMEWVGGAGARGVGHCEIQDTMIEGKPVGLDD